MNTLGNLGRNCQNINIVDELFYPKTSKMELTIKLNIEDFQLIIRGLNSIEKYEEMGTGLTDMLESTLLNNLPGVVHPSDFMRERARYKQEEKRKKQELSDTINILKGNLLNQKRNQ